MSNSYYDLTEKTAPGDSCEDCVVREKERFPELNAFEDLVSELLDELPAEFFNELSGGVMVSERTAFNSEGIADDLVTLGEYKVSRLGKQIVIYYGSFKKMYGHMSGEQLRRAVRDMVRHEFRHHMEWLAGMHGFDSLEAEDKRNLKAYKEKRLKDI